jgi:hypothetical protein
MNLLWKISKSTKLSLSSSQKKIDQTEMINYQIDQNLLLEVK